MLVQNGNILPSVPVAQAANMKETYSSMQLQLRNIRYEEHKWNICGDLKVIVRNDKSTYSYLDYSLVGQSIVAFYVNGIAGTR